MMIGASPWLAGIPLEALIVALFLLDLAALFFLKIG